MFERKNIALRKKISIYKKKKKIETISKHFNFIEIISKSLYCKPRSTEKTMRLETWSCKNNSLRFNCALVKFLLNNLFDNNFCSFKTQRLTSLECIAELQGKQFIENLFAGFVKILNKTICSISEGSIFEQSINFSLLTQLIVFHGNSCKGFSVGWIL